MIDDRDLELEFAESRFRDVVSLLLRRLAGGGDHRNLTPELDALLAECAELANRHPRLTTGAVMDIFLDRVSDSVGLKYAEPEDRSVTYKRRIAVHALRWVAGGIARHLSQKHRSESEIHDAALDYVRAWKRGDFLPVEERRRRNDA